MENRLYVMRHFKTYANENDIYMGQTEWPINYDNICFDNTLFENVASCYLISSPLLRAVQSAKYVIEKTDKTKWVFETSDLIKERGLGKFEGKIKSSINKNPIYFYDKKLILHSTPPRGESIFDFCKRVNQIKPYIRYRLQYDNVLLVSHLQVLRALLCKNVNEETWYNTTFMNGEIKEIDINMLF